LDDAFILNASIKRWIAAEIQIDGYAEDEQHMPTVHSLILSEQNLCNYVLKLKRTCLLHWSCCWPLAACCTHRCIALPNLSCAFDK